MRFNLHLSAEWLRFAGKQRERRKWNIFDRLEGINFESEIRLTRCDREEACTKGEDIVWQRMCTEVVILSESVLWLEV